MNQIKAKIEVIQPFVKVTGVDPKTSEIKIEHNMKSWEAVMALLLDGMKASLTMGLKQRNEGQRIITPVAGMVKLH